MMHLPSTLSLKERRTLLRHMILQHRNWVRKTCSCPRCQSDLADLRLQAMALDAERMAARVGEAMRAAGRMVVKGVVVL